MATTRKEKKKRRRRRRKIHYRSLCSFFPYENQIQPAWPRYMRKNLFRFSKPVPGEKRASSEEKRKKKKRKRKKKKQVKTVA